VRPQIFDDDDEQYLKSPLESNSSMYLDEIKQKLEVVRKVSVSMAAISRFLAKFDHGASPGKHSPGRLRRQMRGPGHATR